MKNYKYKCPKITISSFCTSGQKLQGVDTLKIKGGITSGGGSNGCTSPQLK